MTQERWCCDGRCRENQGRGTCPANPPKPERGSWWLTVALVTIPWIALACILMALKECVPQ